MSTVYSNLKFLNYQDQLEAWKNETTASPVHVRIKPFNHCNHDCWYCAYRVSNLQLGEDMDVKDSIAPEKMEELVDDLVEMGVKAVTFSGGGEPLLYKTLPETIERLANGGVKVATLTNGSNLKGKVGAALAKHATWVRISIDSWDEKSYSESRKIKHGSFAKLLDNIKNFLATGTSCTLGISFIVSEKNYEHLYEACSIFKKAGVDHIKISGAVISNSGKENNIYHNKIRDQVNEEIERATGLNDSSFTIINHYHELEERFDKTYNSCPFLNYLTVIGADSKVYTCQDKAFNKTGELGSIAETSFKEFWHSKDCQKAIHSINPSKDCNHHCVAHEKNLVLHDILSVNKDHVCFV